MGQILYRPLMGTAKSFLRHTYTNKFKFWQWKIYLSEWYEIISTCRIGHKGLPEEMTLNVFQRRTRELAGGEKKGKFQARKMWVKAASVVSQEKSHKVTWCVAKVTSVVRTNWGRTVLLPTPGLSFLSCHRRLDSVTSLVLCSWELASSYGHHSGTQDASNPARPVPY